jgi:hypothetical protein
MAISAGCNYGVTNLSNDEARVDSVTSPQPNVVVLSKQGPQQFTKSTSAQVSNLIWSELGHVEGPLALLSYHITYSGGQAWSSAEQEIPAIFLNNGFKSGVLYYYSGSQPYINPNSSVTQASTASGSTFASHFFFPKRSTPNFDSLTPGQGDQMTEDWLSLCDPTGVKCVTVASFSPDALDVTYIPGSNAYFALHGQFAIKPGLNKTITLWIAPYRFDDVVGGMTVRDWIYLVSGKAKVSANALTLQTKSLLASLNTASLQSHQ